MSKLNAPLFSFSASGQIAKALVYFTWKGLDVVRSYTVPANPKTAKQTTQRGYLKACVTSIHACQAQVDDPFVAADATSYAALGSLEATPETWFNTIVRQWLKQKVATKIPVVYSGGSCVAGSLKLTLKMVPAPESSAITNGTINYGTSKSALTSSIACTLGEIIAGKVITGLSAGVKYYCQFRPTLPTDFVNSNSGIWYCTPTA